MVRVVRPRGKTYWTEFSKGIKASSFTEGVLKKMKRYRRDKLIREQEERGRAESPTIIPFPSEEAQAADGSSDA
jgi:hypothetical protein